MWENRGRGMLIAYSKLKLIREENLV